MNSLTVRRASMGALLFVAVLSLGVSADRAFVSNRGGATVNIFDTTTNTELAGSPVTVGSGPIDIAADRPFSTAPQELFVANSGSNSVSVVWSDPPGAIATLSSDSFFGTFATPSGVALADDGVVGPTIAMVDQKGTSYIYGASTFSGRSTLRFIDPVSNTVVDAFQEPSATARYNDVVFTSDPSAGTRRLWIADDGDGGVTVIKLDNASGPPFYFNRVITYQGGGEFADFVADTSTTPTFLKAPRRLGTNGTTRVVAADAGSKIVTILDGNYASTNTLGEPGAILAQVDLSTWAGAPLPAVAFTGADVKVAGNFAYVTTSNTGVLGANCYQIDLTTFAITAALALGGAGTVQGLGVTSDGATLYVGAGSTGSGTITQLDISPSTDFTAVPPVVLAGFTGGSIPFAFSSSATVGGGGPPPGPGPVWTSTSNTTSTSHSGCGLTGVDALILLLFLRRRLLRRA